MTMQPPAASVAASAPCHPSRRLCPKGDSSKPDATCGSWYSSSRARSIGTTRCASDVTRSGLGLGPNTMKSTEALPPPGAYCGRSQSASIRPPRLDVLHVGTEAALESTPGNSLGSFLRPQPSEFGTVDLVALGKRRGEPVHGLLERGDRRPDLPAPRLGLPRVGGLFGNRPAGAAGLDRDVVPAGEVDRQIAEPVQRRDALVDHPQPPRVGEFGPVAQLRRDHLAPQGHLTHDQGGLQVGLHELLQGLEVDRRVDPAATLLPRQRAVIHAQRALGDQRLARRPGLELVQRAEPSLVGPPVSPTGERIDPVGDAQPGNHAGSGSGRDAGTGSGRDAGTGSGKGSGSGRGPSSGTGLTSGSMMMCGPSGPISTPRFYRALDRQIFLCEEHRYAMFFIKSNLASLLDGEISGGGPPRRSVCWGWRSPTRRRRRTRSS